MMIDPTIEQLKEAFVLDSGGPNPFYRCKECGQLEPGVIHYLSDHWKTHRQESKMSPIDTIRGALEGARNGLLWYTDMYPETHSGADDDMQNEITEALAALDSMKPVQWWNGCDKTVPAALRYLANNDRPSGGESRFNSAHLLQLAEEIERMAKQQLYGE